MMYGPLQYIHVRHSDRAVGKKLGELRAVYRLSEAALADFLEIALIDYQAYEAGRKRVPAAHLHRLAHLFGVQVRNFLPAKPKSLVRVRP